jgi:2-haloalkanoic acid dehalogenase type II
VSGRDGFDPNVLKAVAFDGYGTLFEFETAAEHWYGRELLEQWGLEADHEAFEQSVREAWSNQQALMDGTSEAWVSTWELWRRAYAAALEEHGLDADPRAAADFLRDVLSRLAAYPDARETIERLSAHGLLVGLLSNADEDFLQRCVSRARLRFSVIQSSESLRVYKPHVRAFQELCHRLGCEPREVLYAGDWPASDVAGAVNAGLRTAWVNRDGSEYPADQPPPDIEASSLSAIADAVGAR